MTDKVQKIREEVERRLWLLVPKMTFQHQRKELENILSFIDSLQGEPASEDLEKAAEQDVCEVVNCCSATRIPNDHIPSWVQDAMVNEFIHGVQWQKEQLMKDATDVTVHVDAGGYPYIPQMELYDYDNDVPLAKEGDKYKVVLIKED